MNSYLLVFLGGGLGSSLRFWVGNKINDFNSTQFPFNTFTVNIIASFIIGLLATLSLLKPGQYESQRLLIGIGFCGGLSTFSSFTLETVSLIKEGSTIMAIGYILISVITCILSFVIAQALVK